MINLFSFIRQQQYNIQLNVSCTFQQQIHIFCRVLAEVAAFDRSSLCDWITGIVSNTPSGTCDGPAVLTRTTLTPSCPVWGSLARIWFSLVQESCSADEQVLQLAPAAMGFPLCCSLCIHIQAHTHGEQHISLLLIISAGGCELGTVFINYGLFCLCIYFIE